MEVVINVCYGGFGLSPLATNEIAKRRGQECYFFTTDFTSEKYQPVSLREAKGAIIFHAFTVPNPQDYRLDELGEDGTYKDANERAEKIGIYDRDIPRNDPDLIAVVKELGSRADGRHAKLKIVNIPDDVEWQIEEYDGYEHIAEKHRTWD